MNMKISNLTLQHFILTTLTILAIGFHSGQRGYCESDAVANLEDKILSLSGKYGKDFFNALDEIEGLSTDEAISLCVRLSDYYLGEAGTEVYIEKATKMRQEIIPFLIEKRKGPLMCLEKYKTLCVKDITERNRKIDWVIDAVRRGIVLYGVYPENLEKEAENGMKVIKIFLQDYREKKRDLPKDLSVLQEYVWKEYGYKLRIFNPWGKPFKYTPQNRDKYFVGSGGNN